MSRLYKCGACGAVYMDPQPDNSRYFHACPPVPNKAYQPDAAQPDYDPRDVVLREGHRDENILPGVQSRDGVCVTVSRDPNDTQREVVTPVKELAKHPGAGRTAVDK